jgi:phospholipid-binding lipoprotein MlaA
MSKIDKNTRKKCRFLTGSALAIAILTTTFATGAGAESVEKTPPKSSLFTVYKKWQARRIDSARIEPAAANLSKTTKFEARGAKPASNEDITDAEVLAQDTASQNDPFEPLNRVVFSFNEVLDFIIFTPVNKAYRTVLPKPVRTGVSNVVDNAKTPVILVNDLLQGKPEQAKTTFVRFLINSTAGFGGFVDAAEAGGLPKHTEDFGQTLAVWGVGSGPYLVLPVLGPSSPRHVVGRIADAAASPTTWLLADFGLLEQSAPSIADLVTGHDAIMDDMKNLRSTSPDIYASVRGIYRQSRKNAISDGQIDDDDDLPEIPNE